jgi:hypothetical protein
MAQTNGNRLQVEGGHQLAAALQEVGGLTRSGGTTGCENAEGL